MTLEYKISENDENMTVKDILKKKLNISNRLITKLKLNQKIYINDKEAKINEIPSENSKVIVYIDFEEEDNTIPQKGNLEILYEDDYFLAVNKPADIVVHPCSYHLDNTLSNFVKYYLNNNKKIRPVNRLDNGTSGIVLFAKNEYVQELFKNLKEKPIKEYLALVYGVFEQKEGVISFPIARKPNSIIEREINIKEGQEAITHYKVLKEFNMLNYSVSLINVFLETGRTHQIRVHMSYLGHCLLGDTLYKDESEAERNKEISQVISRQALHAHRLIFKHPITSEKIEITAELPSDIKNLIK